MTQNARLEPSKGMIFESGKVYTHAQGLSCCFRQWRASDSHCRFLHGYSLQVELTFQAKNLDHRNWVMDFGGLKPIKQWLEDTFDHKTLVARDDPQLLRFRELAYWGDKAIIDIVEVEHVGCEAFAKMIYDHVDTWVSAETRVDDYDNGTYTHRVRLESVTVREHAGNFATYRRSS